LIEYLTLFRSIPDMFEIPFSRLMLESDTLEDRTEQKLAVPMLFPERSWIFDKKAATSRMFRGDLNDACSSTTAP